jgi:ABC-type transport system involved in multi-copper enzyme maturation permease subunit
MNGLYHLVRADFLERTRRHGFLVMLCLVLYLGYLVNSGQVTLRLETYRGVYNSAWVGSMMTLVVNFLLGWFGFYFVKNSIARDYETGVGQIIATTPVSRVKYMLGKWLSNFLVLGMMVLVLMLAAVVMQLIQREAQIDLWALLAPFLFVALPFMALIAAFAILFESIRWLRGSFGNIVYFFFFIGGLSAVAILLGVNIPLLDWLGFGIFKNSMAVAAKTMYPAYQDGLTLSLVPASAEIQPFFWAGVAWTLPVVLNRLLLIVWSLGFILLSVFFFDGFGSTQTKLSLRRKPASVSHEIDPAIESTSTPKIQLTPLTPSRVRSRFGRIFLAELQLLLKGQPWWWYFAVLGFVAASFLSPLEQLRETVLPFSLLLPTLLWSGLGNRETRLNTHQMVFSAPHPLWNQLSAAWLAGLTIAVLIVAGSAVTFIMDGAISNLTSLLVGVIFIPSLALALGVWTGGSKAFEVVYVLFWYIGLLNKVPELDYVGLHTPDYWLVYLALTLVLLATAVFGRNQQLKGRLG